MGDSGVSIRRAPGDDRPQVIELCRASLGWRVGDPNEEFFAWKHDENPQLQLMSGLADLSTELRCAVLDVPRHGHSEGVKIPFRRNVGPTERWQVVHHDVRLGLPQHLDDPDVQQVVSVAGAGSS